MTKIYLGGLKTYLGKDKISIDKIARRFGRDKKNVFEKSGAKNLYRFRSDINLVKCASRLLRSSEKIVGREVDEIVVSLCTQNDAVFPTFGVKVAYYLKRNILSFISNPGCLGIVHALRIAYNEVSSSPNSLSVAVIVGDYISKNLKKDDFRSQAIFSDALAVVIVSNVRKGMTHEMNRPEISQWHEGAYIMAADPIYKMQAGKIVEFVEKRVGSIIKKINNYVIPHDASRLAIINMIEKNKIDAFKIYTDGMKTGNKTSASVLFGLEQNMDKKNLTLVPFGAEFGIGKITLKRLINGS